MTLKFPVDQMDTSVKPAVFCVLTCECDIKEALSCVYPGLQSAPVSTQPTSTFCQCNSAGVLECWDPGLYTVRHRHKIETGTDWKMAACCTQSPTRLSLSSSCWLLLTITLRFLLKLDPGLSVDSVANNLELSN